MKKQLSREKNCVIKRFGRNPEFFYGRKFIGKKDIKATQNGVIKKRRLFIFRKNRVCSKCLAARYWNDVDKSSV
ncbi:hypothetical protein HMPREF9124_1762 [Oribacterium sp. oral taxon 108 str. F0425]|nr:hypothetical protein HMPREF9124_1762 [Oribacterium sp. oral taxon 108 str. F0425]